MGHGEYSGRDKGGLWRGTGGPGTGHREEDVVRVRAYKTWRESMERGQSMRRGAVGYMERGYEGNISTWCGVYGKASIRGTGVRTSGTRFVYPGEEKHDWAKIARARL